MDYGRDRGLRSPPPGPVRIFGETFGRLPFGSTPLIADTEEQSHCPPSLSCSSVTRRVMTALVGFAQGDLARTCRRPSVHCEAGLLSQTRSDQASHRCNRRLYQKRAHMSLRISAAATEFSRFAAVPC